MLGKGIFACNLRVCPKKFWPGLSEMGFEIERDYPRIFFSSMVLFWVVLLLW